MPSTPDARQLKPIRVGALTLALGFALVLALGWLPVARFQAETIRITVEPEGYTVDGWYTYANPLPIPWVQGLVVPTASGEGLEAPASVAASLTRPWGEDLHVLWLLGRPRLQVPIPAREAVEIRITFHQQAPARRGTYLLKTTRPWGRPIEEAAFFLVPRCTRILGSSLDLEAVTGSGYRIRDFFPDTDWTFTWEPAPCDG